MALSDPWPRHGGVPLWSAFFAILHLAGCERPTAPIASPTAQAPVREATVVRARTEAWPLAIRVQGSLLAYEDAVIGSKLSGRVEEVAVDLGSIVRQGDLLVTLVRTELELRVGLAEAQLQQACAVLGITPADDESAFDPTTAPGPMMEQALVSEAESNVERTTKLIASRAVSEGEYNTIVAQWKAAQARFKGAVNLVGEHVATIGVRRKELALARQMVADAQIVAPFDGVVGERLVSPGETIQAGQAVISVVRADVLRFTAGVPESRAEAVRVGQRVELSPGSNSAGPLAIAISRLSPTVTQSSRSLMIEADVPNHDLALRAGLFVQADVIVDPTAQAVVLPLSAVSRLAGVQKVWIVEKGTARQQTVRTGREAADRVEVVAGLDEGSLVVLHAEEGQDGPIVPHESATDGAPPTDSTSLSARRPEIR